MYQLKIIIASTRPMRKGPAIAAWAMEMAQQHSEFETELVDLAEVNLPFLDEPAHPMMRKYTKQHTKDWSARIEAADAFIIVTPEYNYGYPAPLKNALDFLYHEWGYKPVGFVSYGGVAGGTRAVQALKQVVTAQKMMPIPESVNIPFFSQHIDDAGKFTATEVMQKGMEGMLNELLKWCGAMKVMRNPN